MYQVAISRHLSLLLNLNQTNTKYFPRVQCHSRSVSCVDCSSSFGSAEFKLHIKCITESEKYEAKSSYVEKAKKGDVKQNAWCENVVAAVAGFRGSSRAKDLLEKLTEFPNIPRKKAKFFNFMRNSFRSYGVHDGLLGEVWTVIESFDKKQPEKKAVEVVGVKRKVDTDEVAEVGKAKKVAKKVEVENKKFDWIESSRLEFARKEGREIKFKKLFKKVGEKLNFKKKM